MSSRNCSLLCRLLTLHASGVDIRYLSRKRQRLRGSPLQHASAQASFIFITFLACRDSPHLVSRQDQTLVLVTPVPATRNKFLVRLSGILDESAIAAVTYLSTFFFDITSFGNSMRPCQIDSSCEKKNTRSRTALVLLFLRFHHAQELCILCCRIWGVPYRQEL